MRSTRKTEFGPTLSAPATFHALSKSHGNPAANDGEGNDNFDKARRPSTAMTISGALSPPADAHKRALGTALEADADTSEMTLNYHALSLVLPAELRPSPDNHDGQVGGE